MTSTQDSDAALERRFDALDRQLRAAEREAQGMQGIINRYEAALLWIRHLAGLHYFGGAYEPEHMRDLANMASDALDLRWDPDGKRLRRDLPDYEAEMADARAWARDQAEAYGLRLADRDRDDEEE